MQKTERIHSTDKTIHQDCGNLNEVFAPYSQPTQESNGILKAMSAPGAAAVAAVQKMELADSSGAPRVVPTIRFTPETQKPYPQPQLPEVPKPVPYYV